MKLLGANNLDELSHRMVNAKRLEAFVSDEYVPPKL